MSIFIGIDTSNYKTSLAACDEGGNIVFNSSDYLEVPKGQRGLRQQEAFFKHSQVLPGKAESLFEIIDAGDVAAVGVSERPRRVEGSYMPCFMAGVSAARYISSALGVPLYGFSHQEGHAAAVIPEGTGRCLFFHLSGGTSEYLLCSPDSEGYDMQIVGGTKDISFGMLLDRMGVELGFPFPSGMYLDGMASSFKSEKSYDRPGLMPPVKLDDGYFNLSGPETRLMDFARDYVKRCGKSENTADEAHSDAELRAASYELFENIANLLTRSAAYLCGKYETDDVFIAGGVASSDTLRSIIKADKSTANFNIHFGEPALSGDNAVGIAHLASRIHRSKLKAE